ncbi:MAG: hypothetical protein J5641_06050 [Bacteroidales bacterium]|nr:hypothetical protein [Bacteroidales bacterium]
MEENELIILNNSKKHIVRSGKWMNIFSIFAVFSVLFLVAGGIVLLFVSGYLDEATPYYLDNVLGFAGIGLVILAAALLPAIVCMRRAVQAAKQVKMNNDLVYSVDFLRQTHYMWHYLMILFVVGFSLAVLAAIAALIIYWPTLRVVFG